MDRDALRRRLTALAEKTKGTDGQPLGGFWVGDVAGERAALDDLVAGRLHWRTAHQHAVAGLQALEQGDLEMARVCATEGHDLFTEALEIRVRPSDVKVLERTARRRGRPRGSRNRKKD